MTPASDSTTRPQRRTGQERPRRRRGTRPPDPVCAPPSRGSVVDADREFLLWQRRFAELVNTWISVRGGESEKRALATRVFLEEAERWQREQGEQLSPERAGVHRGQRQAPPPASRGGAGPGGARGQPGNDRPWNWLRGCRQGLTMGAAGLGSIGARACASAPAT